LWSALGRSSTCGGFRCRAKNGQIPQFRTDFTARSTFPDFCLAAIPLAFVSPGIAIAIYVFVALLWLVPDRRIERALVSQAKE
jgi:hypothetical protein